MTKPIGPEKSLADDLRLIKKLADEQHGHRTTLLQWKKRAITALAAMLEEDAEQPHWVKESDEPQDQILYSLIELTIAREIPTQLNMKDENKRLKAFLNRKSEILNNEVPSILKATLTDEELLVPILQCARLVQAIFSRPDSTIKSGWIIANYEILNELFAVEPPNWIVGSAKANQNASVASAFITGECTKARGYVARAFRLTSKVLQYYLRCFDNLLELLELPDRLASEKFKKAELKRILMAYWNEINSLKRRSMLNINLDDFRRIAKVEQYTHDKVNELITTILKSLVDACRDLALRANRAIPEMGLIQVEIQNNVDKLAADSLNDPKNNVHDIKNRNELMQKTMTAVMARDQVFLSLSESAAHLDILIYYLDLVIKEYPAGRTDIRNEINIRFKSILLSTCQLFDEVAYRIDHVNKSCVQYFRGVLSRELSLEGTPRFNLGEMIFSAASLSEIAFDENRLIVKQACDIAVDYIAENGLAQFDGPVIAVDNKGRNITVTGTEIIRAFTQLIANSDAEITEDLIDNVMEYFKSITKPENEYYKDVAGRPPLGFYNDFRTGKETFYRYTTALALLALDKTCRMIDSFVNRRIARHFEISSDTSLSLSNLIYSDYGFANLSKSSRDVREAYQYNVEALGTSVAFVLENMRSHLCGIDPLDPDSQKTVSSIFFGPPGTGKTTLPLALSVSAKSPCIVVTPGDVAKNSEHRLDSSVNDVFEALSFLRGYTVLFDEFDPLISDRMQQSVRDNLITTNTLLHRFAKLQGRFKNGRSVFVLSTNRVGSLDDAAIRKGRIDVKIGIFFMDRISLLGRLAMQLNKLKGFKSYRDPQKSAIYARIESAVLKADCGFSLLELTSSSGNLLRDWTDRSPPHQSFNDVALNDDSEINPAFLAREYDLYRYTNPERVGTADNIGACEIKQMDLLCKMYEPQIP
ncbi:MAG: ATP-binding protein [Pirellula sp.]